MITGSQCRAARALTDLSRERLSISAAVSVEAILRSERKRDKPNDDEVFAFIPDNGGGIGVRLKFSKSVAKGIDILENEGGIVARDRVP